MQRLLAPSLQKVVDHEHFGLVTVTRVLVTKDFDYADVYVSAIFNSDDLRDVLRAHVWEVQQELNKKIERYRVPKIRFFVDTTGEYVQRIEQKIKAM